LTLVNEGGDTSTVATKPKAFVLIPFDEEFTDVWEQLLKPDLEEAGFVAERADTRLDQQSILRDIVRGIAEADLVVADLTSLNPNVFYELGIAHGLEVPTILISQVVEEVPFDLRSYRVEEYSIHFARVNEFRDKLREIATKHRDGGIEFGSPVKDFLGASGRRSRGPRPGTSPAGDEASLEEEEEAAPTEEEEAGFLDFVVDVEEQSDRLSSIFEAISTATEEVGTKVEARTQRLGEIQSSGRADAPKLLHVTMQQAANDLNEYATNLERRLPELESTADVMATGFSGYVNWFSRVASDDEDRAQIEVLRESVEGMRAGAHETVPSLQEYRDSFEQLQGISRPLTSASKRAAGAVSRIISVVEGFEAFSTRAVSLLDETLAAFAPMSEKGLHGQAGTRSEAKPTEPTATPERPRSDQEIERQAPDS
jgi:hypothetical protein